MNIKTEQKMDMYIAKITWYITYIDCFTRIINEFIENGEGNLNQNDIPNLMEFNTKLTNRLYKIVMHLKSDWEFMQ